MNQLTVTSLLGRVLLMSYNIMIRATVHFKSHQLYRYIRIIRMTIYEFYVLFNK